MLPLSPMFEPAERVPAGLRLRRLVRLYRTILPALAAAVAAFAIGGGDPAAAARGAVLGVAILTAALLVRGLGFPIRFMPGSRFMLALLAPLFGGVVASGLALTNAYGLTSLGLIRATALASLVALVAEYGGDRLLAHRPLRVAVLGSRGFAAGLKRELEETRLDEIEVIGWINLGGPFSIDGESSQIGTVDSIRAAVTEHDIDLLVRGSGEAGESFSRGVYDAIAEGCVDLPVRMMNGSQLYEMLFGHVPLGTIDADWFLYLMHPNFEGTSRLSKRLLDLALVCMLAPLALPLVALAAVAIKLDDRGPVVFRQRRIGEGGREFEILKLRTMRLGAESSGARWSLATDDRVTRVGRVLRRTHVDELPQLLNVLRGEMTMVGPRPERPEMIANLERLLPRYKRRLLVKPGVTGWAQVRCGYAGSELGTAWKLCHDLFYLKHASMLADMLILFQTLIIAARDSHRPLRAPQPEFLSDRVERISSVLSPPGAEGPEPSLVPEINLRPEPGITALHAG